MRQRGGEEGNYEHSTRRRRVVSRCENKGICVYTRVCVSKLLKKIKKKDFRGGTHCAPLSSLPLSIYLHFRLSLARDSFAQQVVAFLEGTRYTDGAN